MLSGTFGASLGSFPTGSASGLLSSAGRAALPLEEETLLETDFVDCVGSVAVSVVRVGGIREE
jgi:hypothetical protein